MSKVIVYTRPGGGVSVCRPAEGFRLATGVRMPDGTYRADPLAVPVPVDQLARPWPIAGAVAEWAETEQEFLARVAAKDVPAGATGTKVLDASAVPADRTFRRAWKLDPAGIGHDMADCRAIWRDKLRELRAPIMAALDVEYMRADEVGDTAKKAAIAAKKQALRDVTKDPAIDAAATPEELKAVLPAALRA